MSREDCAGAIVPRVRGDAVGATVGTSHEDSADAIVPKVRKDVGDAIVAMSREDCAGAIVPKVQMKNVFDHDALHSPSFLIYTVYLMNIHN
jgi:hypothetical protein